ncbi:MAG: hypothetical protein R3332_02780 [Pseudohongiellaceae bacterium]|nr:hypothetical protein [Pseudohongiellaceae bacterium]
MSVNMIEQAEGSQENYHGILDVTVQQQEIEQIASLLPLATVQGIREKLLSLSSDERFVMNYWLKVCKLRAVRGLPMPWDVIH